jgi:hypothetical protein
VSTVPKRRLQVFVSSTYLDLKEERQAAVETILDLGHVPAGMELFAAGDESQLETIKQWIEESDAYLLILGHRYGSIEPTSCKSYTHLEYEHALSLKKPLFAVVATEDWRRARQKRLSDANLDPNDVLEMKHPKELDAFRTTVLSKTSAFFHETSELKLAIHKAVPQLERKHKFVGWVRGDSIDDAEALKKELAEVKALLGKRDEETKLKDQFTLEMVGVNARKAEQGRRLLVEGTSASTTIQRPVLAYLAWFSSLPDSQPMGMLAFALRASVPSLPPVTREEIFAHSADARAHVIDLLRSGPAASDFYTGLGVVGALVMITEMHLHEHESEDPQRWLAHMQTSISTGIGVLVQMSKEAILRRPANDEAYREMRMSWDLLRSGELSPRSLLAWKDEVVRADRAELAGEPEMEAAKALIERRLRGEPENN